MVKLKFPRIKASAFTLIETLITLTICCGILLIGSLQLRKSQNRLIFDNTTKEVMAALDQASRISTIYLVQIIISKLRLIKILILKDSVNSALAVQDLLNQLL